MHVTMVKKRLASGEPCPKCLEAEQWLRAQGLAERIDEVVWYDERDPDSPGHVLARAHAITLAPFFLVRDDPSSAPRVFTSALALARALRGSSNASANAPLSSAGSDASDATPATPTPPTLDLADAQAGHSTLATLATLATLTPPEIVAWALSRFGSACTIAFSGAEDVVLIDLAARSGHPYSVFSLDTGRLHPETLEFIDRVRAHYQITIDVVSPDASVVERLVRDKGLMSMRQDGHEECCGIRKVAPLARALATRAAWMTGQRPDQSPATRAGIPTIQQDSRGLWKLNPLATWTSADVWHWITAHDVPFNPLHTQGYRSIGCAPCTRPVHPGQHEREGRWWWEDATRRECGLHLTKP